MHVLQKCLTDSGAFTLALAEARLKLRRARDARVKALDVSKLLNSVLAERAAQGTLRMRARVRIEGFTSRRGTLFWRFLPTLGIVLERSEVAKGSRGCPVRLAPSGQGARKALPIEFGHEVAMIIRDGA